jgi:hypothetical protein
MLPDAIIIICYYMSACLYAVIITASINNCLIGEGSVIRISKEHRIEH